MGTGRMAFASRASRSPRRIGVFIGSLDDSFQKAIWTSVAEGAAREGVEIVAFFGQGLGSPIPTHATMNVLYRLAGPQNLDALIVISSTVGNFQEPQALAAFVRGLGLPSVSIQYELEGMPSVSTRGDAAMRDLVRHLAREHGRRSFALLTGPRRHLDSLERERAFRETLAEEGIAFDEALLYEGSFYKDSGPEAVERFLASGRAFDALVCFNDAMALGAMDALKSRGVDVPGEVSVTGFDDIEEASWSSPPLTTARQPIADIGRLSLELALGLLGGASPPSESLECRFVARRSCGCPPFLPITPALREETRLTTRSEARIIRALSASADSGDIQAMLRLLDSRLAEGGETPADFASLRIILYKLRSKRGESGLADSVGWFDQALAFLGETERRKEVGQSIKAAERYALVRDLGTQLLDTFSLDALVRKWEQSVKRLGLGPSYLVLFESTPEPGAAAVPETSVLVTASPGGGIARLPFPTIRLFPPGIGDRPGRVGWIVEPLVYQTEALGYLLIDSASDESIVYETLREHMSTAVKATLLMEEIEEQKRILERQVEHRTEELRASNRDLEEQIAQRRLLEAEVQEIGNRTMQAIGQDIHDDLCQRLIGVSMLAAALEEGAALGAGDPRGSLREIRELLDDAVARSRQFARSLYPPGLEELGLVSALEDLSSSLGRAGTAHGGGGGPSVSFQAEGDCRVEDPRRALQLYRIVQEALSNALRHSGSEVILLRLFKKDGELVAEVRDFGVGLKQGREIEGRAPGANGGGMGLRIMRYRADSIGARLEIRNLEPGVCVSCALDQKEGWGKWRKR